jgi:hypothetical protein
MGRPILSRFFFRYRQSTLVPLSSYPDCGQKVGFVSALDLDEFRSPADIHDGKNKKKVWTEAERLKAKGAVPVLSLSEFSDQVSVFYSDVILC